MPHATTENGDAQTLQRIEQDFAAHRERLETERVHFAQWEQAWTTRQAGIADSLRRLQERLQTPPQREEPVTLRFPAPGAGDDSPVAE